MKFKNLISEDIPSCVLLHQKNLKSPGSEIGAPYLEKFYRLIIEEPNIFEGIGIVEKGNIAGVILGTEDFLKAETVFKKILSLKLLWVIFVKIIENPSLIIGLLERLIFQYQVKKELDNRISLGEAASSAYILVLFVDKRFQNQGLGKKLVKELFKRLKTKTIYVDTYLSNQKAREFYKQSFSTNKSLGFKEVKKISSSILLKHD